MEQTLTVNGTEYSVLKLLGKGKGGYSYLVTRDGQCYTLKQIHHEPCDYYTFGDKLGSELRDHAHLRSLGIPMPALYEADMDNERILKEYIHGPSVYELVLHDRMKPEYFAQLRAMCETLYAANTNIDYFPTNFIVRDRTLFYIDYECNRYMEEWNFENWGIRYWSKTPEFCEYARTHNG